MDLVVNRLTIDTEQKRLVDISFTIRDSFALVGESGSGKSLTIKALLGMLAPNLKVNLDIDSDFELKRGKSVSTVLQNPFTSLSPLTKIEKQFHLPAQKAKEYMQMVGLDESLLSRFPSELSGGQLQRVVIAIALSLKPKLLLLDEPTTALDSKTKDLILDLILDLQKRFGYKILFVTHDIESTKTLSQDIAIIKDGIIVESAGVDEIFNSPKDDYTKELIASNFKSRRYRI